MLVSAGADRQIRVWSYNQNASKDLVQLQISEQCVDEILALALHPSGNQFVVAFNASARFYNLYPKRMQQYH